MLDQTTQTQEQMLPDKTPAQSARQDMSSYAKAQRTYVNANRTLKRPSWQDMMDANREELEALLKTGDRNAVRQRMQELFFNDIDAYDAEGKRLYAQYKKDNSEATSNYYRARRLLQNQRVWEKNKVGVISRFNNSVDSTRKWVDSQRVQIQWLRDCKPSEEDWGNIDGVDKRGNVSIDRRSAWKSMRQSIEGIADRAEEQVDVCEAEVDFGEASAFADVISCVENDFGLTHVYEEVDDGFLWFIDEETNVLYYFSKSNHVIGKTTVLGNYRKNNYVGEKWRDRPSSDLIFSMTVGGLWQTGVEQSVRVSGLWNKVRTWVKKSIDAGNSVPDGFPVSLVENDI